MHFEKKNFLDDTSDKLIKFKENIIKDILISLKGSW